MILTSITTENRAIPPVAVAKGLHCTIESLCDIRPERIEHGLEESESSTPLKYTIV